MALLLAEPERELSVSGVADMTGVPYPSVHREIGRAESAGIVQSRKLRNTRLVRANLDSPYFAGLADVLIKAFGPPRVIGRVLAEVPGITGAYIYGSWAANASGHATARPVGDIDVLVLGSPDRAQLYEAIRPVERRLGRDVQVTIRPSDWMASGHGSFHATVTSREMVAVPITPAGATAED